MNRSLPSLKALQEETNEIYRHSPRLTPVQWTLRSYSQLLMSPLLFAPISWDCLLNEWIELNELNELNESLSLYFTLNSTIHSFNQSINHWIFHSFIHSFIEFCFLHSNGIRSKAMYPSDSPAANSISKSMVKRSTLLAVSTFITIPLHPPKSWKRRNPKSNWRTQRSSPRISFCQRKERACWWIWKTTAKRSKPKHKKQTRNCPATRQNRGKSRNWRSLARRKSRKHPFDRFCPSLSIFCSANQLYSFNWRVRSYSIKTWRAFHWPKSRAFCSPSRRIVATCLSKAFRLWRWRKRTVRIAWMKDPPICSRSGTTNWNTPNLVWLCCPSQHQKARQRRRFPRCFPAISRCSAISASFRWTQIRSLKDPKKPRWRRSAGNCCRLRWTQSNQVRSFCIWGMWVWFWNRRSKICLCWRIWWSADTIRRLGWWTKKWAGFSSRWKRFERNTRRILVGWIGILDDGKRRKGSMRKWSGFWKRCWSKKRMWNRNTDCGRDGSGCEWKD